MIFFIVGLKMSIMSLQRAHDSQEYCMAIVAQMYAVLSDDSFVCYKESPCGFFHTGFLNCVAVIANRHWANGF